MAAGWAAVSIWIRCRKWETPLPCRKFLCVQHFRTFDPLSLSHTNIKVHLRTEAKAIKRRNYCNGLQQLIVQLRAQKNAKRQKLSWYLSLLPTCVCVCVCVCVFLTIVYCTTKFQHLFLSRPENRMILPSQDGRWNKWWMPPSLKPSI